MTLASTANPSPLTRPIAIAALTTRSKIWRRMSLSRKRFNRFSENGRVVGNRVVEIEPAEPPIGEVKHHLLAQLPLRAQAVAVTDNQHPDHQLRIDRRPADLPVIGLQLLMHIGEHRRHEYIDAPEQVALRDMIVEPKLIE